MICFYVRERPPTAAPPLEQYLHIIIYYYIGAIEPDIVPYRRYLTTPRRLCVAYNTYHSYFLPWPWSMVPINIIPPAHPAGPVGAVGDERHLRMHAGGHPVRPRAGGATANRSTRRRNPDTHVTEKRRWVSSLISQTNVIVLIQNAKSNALQYTIPVIPTRIVRTHSPPGLRRLEAYLIFRRRSSSHHCCRFASPFLRSKRS